MRNTQHVRVGWDNKNNTHRRQMTWQGKQKITRTTLTLWLTWKKEREKWHLLCVFSYQINVSKKLQLSQRCFYICLIWRKRNPPTITVSLPKSIVDKRNSIFRCMFVCVFAFSSGLTDGLVCHIWGVCIIVIMVRVLRTDLSWNKVIPVR